MYKTLLVGLLLCFTSSYLFSQVRPKPQAEDIQLAKKLRKQYPKDDLVALQKRVDYTFSIEKSKKGDMVIAHQSEYQEILQIKEGYGSSYINMIGYDSTSSVDNVRFMHKKERQLKSLGTTANSSYESEGIFHSDARLFKMAFPMDGQGCFTAIGFEKNFREIKYFTSNYFHENYPVISQTVTYTIPQWLNMELIIKNESDFNIKRVEKTGKDGSKIITYTSENLSANKQENNQPGNSFYLPHVFVHLKGFTDKAGKKQNIFGTPTDLYTWYRDLASGAGNDATKIKSLTEELIKNKKTDQEKIETLFYWVQDNIRYIAFESGVAGFRPDACQNVYKKKYGDCKGMANLLKEMLKITGYDARLTWLGTRSIAYDYSIPSVAVDNHMICTVFLDGKKYYLDPTEKYIGFGDIAHRIQNRPVMIEDNDKFILERTPLYTKERNKKETTINFVLKGDQLVGKARETYDGEGKTQILQSYSMLRSDVKENAIKKLINRSDKNISVQGIKTTDFDERHGSIVLDYEIAVSNQVLDLDKEKFITLDFDQELKGFSFDSTRTKDYIYDYNYYSIKNIEFTIPAGYKVQSIPQSVEKKTANYTVQLNYKQVGNKIIYSKIFSIDNAIIPKSDFPDWNETIKKITKAYGDQLILEKV